MASLMTQHKNKYIKCLGMYELYGKSSFEGSGGSEGHRCNLIIRFIVTNIHNAGRKKKELLKTQIEPTCTSFFLRYSVEKTVQHFTACRLHHVRPAADWHTGLQSHFQL